MRGRHLLPQPDSAAQLVGLLQSTNYAVLLGLMSPIEQRRQIMESLPFIEDRLPEKIATCPHPHHTLAVSPAVVGVRQVKKRWKCQRCGARMGRHEPRIVNAMFLESLGPHTKVKA